MNNNQNNNNSPGNDFSGQIVSWIITLILLFAFTPVGIIMLLSKLSKYAKRSEQQRAASGRATTQTASPQSKSVTYTSAAARPASKKAKKKTGKEKKGISFLLLMIAIALFLIGGNIIYGALRDAITASVFDRAAVWELIKGASFGVGGVLSLIVRGTGLKRVRKFNKYLAVMGDAKIVRVGYIASSTGISEKKVRKDLQAMLDDSYFPAGAYFDSGLDCLVLSHEAAGALRREKETAADEASRQDRQQETEYAAIIKELQTLNVSIIDEGISAKIERIEELTAKIFKIVESSPEKLPQIRRFMNYYLPTTLKLLRSYDTLERQGVHGENITAAKESIDSVLEKLAVGFEQQLDQLFRSENIDISSDISVLENMMAQDGLSSTGNLLQASSGEALPE